MSEPVDRRRKNVRWFAADERGYTPNVWHKHLAVLMDIRDELERINNVLHCSNFLQLPFKVERIARNTSKPRKKRRK